jgi:hypothetical protein
LWASILARKTREKNLLDFQNLAKTCFVRGNFSGPVPKGIVEMKKYLDNSDIDAAYCLDAPEAMPAGGMASSSASVPFELIAWRAF